MIDAHARDDCDAALFIDKGLLLKKSTAFRKTSFQCGNLKNSYPSHTQS
jgi:hypothetical protein